MPVETIEDHHIKIKPTSKLIDFIVKKIKNNKDAPDNIKELQSVPVNKRDCCVLTLSDIKWIKSFILEQKKSGETVYLHELLEGVDIQLPQPKVTPRNPELEARIKKLQAQQDARDYQAMTKSVDSFRKHLPEDTIAYQMKLMNTQLIAVAQFVFSVAAGFAFGFVGLEWSMGPLDFGFRLLLGIMCALIIALAEIYFLAKKLSEEYDDPPSQPTSRTHLHQD